MEIFIIDPSLCTITRVKTVNARYDIIILNYLYNSIEYTHYLCYCSVAPKIISLVVIDSTTTVSDAINTM